MSEENPVEEGHDVASNIRRLGDNLVELLQAAWDRPERKKVQSDVEKGLDDFGKSVQKATDDFAESETAQKLKSGVDDFRGRVDEKGITDTVRSDLEDVLERLNAQLEKLSGQLREDDAQPPEEQA